MCTPALLWGDFSLFFLMCKIKIYLQGVGSLMSNRHHHVTTEPGSPFPKGGYHQNRPRIFSRTSVPPQSLPHQAVQALILS